MPRGGHFPAIEEPELLARDIAGFFGSLLTRSHYQLQTGPARSWMRGDKRASGRRRVDGRVDKIGKAFPAIPAAVELSTH